MTSFSRIASVTSRNAGSGVCVTISDPGSARLAARVGHGEQLVQQVEAPGRAGVQQGRARRRTAGEVDLEAVGVQAAGAEHGGHDVLDEGTALRALRVDRQRRALRVAYAGVGGRALGVPRLPPEQHLLALGVPCRDEPGQVGPLARVGAAGGVPLLPLVVDHDRARHDPWPARRVEEASYSSCVPRRGPGCRRGGQRALRAPAAEDRLPPVLRRPPAGRGGSRPRAASSSR